MESTEKALSAIDAIETVAFKVGLKGYNVDEVDEFLERLAVETRQLKDQVLQQRQQLRQAAERINQLESGRPGVVPAPAPAPAAAPAAQPLVVPSTPRVATAGTGAEQVTSMIAIAQQFIEHAQEEAEAKARELTTTAQEKAREIIAEARGRAEDEVNRLNGLKQRLSEDVETLTRQLAIERTRLGGVLAQFQRWIEDSLQMGGSVRPPSDATPAVSSGTPTLAMSSSNDEEVHDEEQESSPNATANEERPLNPPPAPAASAPTIGQVLRFEPRDDRS